MKYAAASNAPFVIRTGAGGRHLIIQLVTILVAVFGALVSSMGIAETLLVVALCLLTFAYLLICRSKIPSSVLSIYPDGTVTWAEQGNIRNKGRVKQRAWTTSYYAVIWVEVGGKVASYLISRRLQSERSFRALLRFIKLNIYHLQEPT